LFIEKYLLADSAAITKKRLSSKEEEEEKSVSRFHNCKENILFVIKTFYFFAKSLTTNEYLLQASCFPRDGVSVSSTKSTAHFG
jgi:hypothetical protein